MTTGFSICPLASRAQEVDDEHLDRARDRDRGERSEHAGDLCADEDRDEDHERRERDGPPVHERLQHVILHLLIDDEEHDHDDAGDDRCAGTRPTR